VLRIKNVNKIRFFLIRSNLTHIAAIPVQSVKKSVKIKFFCS
jgi:hypothetical protein